MNRSQSQPQLPVKKVKPDFIYRSDEENIIFDTRDLFMQIEFKSTIREIAEYLEEYEKYCFYSNITSISIKAKQEKEYADRIQSMINSNFNTYLQKTMKQIESMIMNVHFMKVEQWHYYSQIIKGFKTNLLNKDLDCYSFEPEQFNDHYNEVIKHLKDINENKSESTLKQIKMSISSNKKLIANKLASQLEGTFVKKPFKAQNERTKEIDSSKLFNEYMNKVVYHNYELEDSIILKFDETFEKIDKFHSVICSLYEQCQKNANEIIKDYNEKCAELMNQIAKTKLSLISESEIELGEYNNIENYRPSKIVPILRNKEEKVSFSNRILIKDEASKNLYAAFTKEEPKYISQPRGPDEELSSNRVPANNPYFDYWAHTYDREKLRRLELYYERPKKDYERTKILPNFSQKLRIKVSHKKPQGFGESKYAISIANRTAEELKIWDVKNKRDSHSRESYECKDEALTKEYSYFINKDNGTQQYSKLFLLEMKKKGYEKYQETNEKGREEELNLIRNNKKKYEMYVSKFGIKTPITHSDSSKITRYGISINKSLELNTEIRQLEEFCCHVLKEKLFTDFEKYQTKETMPLIFNSKSAKDFCDWRVIKKLGELTQTNKRYFLWASEIIKYEEVLTVNKLKKGVFTIYAYSNVIHSQSILFELKRRLNMDISGQILDTYVIYGENSVESVVSKLELLHRLIFNQHMETPTAELNYEKGRHIFNSIVKGLSNEEEN